VVTVQYVRQRAYTRSAARRHSDLIGVPEPVRARRPRSLYIVIGLGRLTVAGLRWSAGRLARRLLAAVAGLAALAALAAFWTMQGPVPRAW